jgi:hypothetical protein
MRVEAAEFVPGAPLAFSHPVLQQDQPVADTSGSEEPRQGVTAAKSALSADALEFVPGGATLNVEPWPRPSDKSNGKMSPLDFLMDEQFAVAVADQEKFLIPQLLEPTESDSGSLQIEGQRVLWDVPGVWEELSQTPRDQCLTSRHFSVAGSWPLRLAFFPTGAALTEDGNSAVGLICEEKQKLKFELFLNARSSGMKVMLGKKFSCDFRQPQASEGTITVGAEVHENLYFAGFGYG